jgi:two-component system, NtrC family, sensor histidine kinase AtoS
MNQNSPSISRTALWRGKSPGMIEFGTMMNLLPQAALLFDRGRGIILQVNTELIKLTAFTQNELCGKDIKDLLTELPFESLAPGEELTLLLKRRKRDDLPVVARVNGLDATGQWMLLDFIPAENIHSDQTQEKITHNLLALTRLHEEPDLDHAVKKGLEILSSLLDAGLIGIYQAESDQPRLRKLAVFEAAAVFPEEISSSDLVRLSSPTLWIPGKRVNTDIHRAGRIANLAYLATSPLGDDKALSGLLVVGDQEKQPSEFLIPYIEIAAKYLSSTIQHFILIATVRRENDDLERRLAVNTCVMENTQEAVFVLNPDLTVAQLNPTAEVIFGYGAWEARGQAVENLLIGSEKLISSLVAACSGIPTRNMGNCSLHRRDGQAFPARVEVLPVQKDEQLRAVLVFVIDNSENEQIRTHTQQLENQAELGEITAMFAHEIRNPINNISTGLQLLASRLGEDDPNQEVINKIQSDCSRLDHLMESVLAFSRPMEHRFEPVDVGSLLVRLMDRYRPRMARLNIVPFIQVEENCPKGMGDARALERVFINLINNAIDAMNKGGGTLAIHVSINHTVVNHTQIEVAVSDNGPGIPDDIRERLFEPFLTSKQKGTGLGLAITKRIVTAHQGSIEVNTFPGGTVFHVYLPAIQDGV